MAQPPRVRGGGAQRGEGEMARKSPKGLARRVSVTTLFGLLLVALVCLPTLPAYGVTGEYQNNPTPSGGGGSGMTTTWDVYYGPNMLPRSNPQRSIGSGSWEAHVETHYPYFGDGDMAWWYNHYCAAVGGVEAAGMDCLAYWVVAVYDLGAVTAATEDERNTQEAALIHEASVNRGNDYAWWNARQLLYTGPPINTTTYKNVETQPSNFGTAVGQTLQGWWGSGSGWRYWNRMAGETTGVGPNWPGGLTRITAHARPVEGTGKTTRYQLTVGVEATPGTDAYSHVYWISITGVSGREKVVYSSGSIRAPWKEEPPNTTPKMSFRVNVKPAGYSGLGWIVGDSRRNPEGSVGRWGNTGKPVNLKATLQDSENLRVTQIEIRVTGAVTVEGDGITKLIFTGSTPGGTAIREGGRVVGYRWTGTNLNNRNPEVTFYYTQAENTKFSIDFWGVGTGPVVYRNPIYGHVGYTLLVGGTRLVDYGTTASSR